MQFVVAVGVPPNCSCLLSMQMNWHEWSKFWKIVDVAMKDAWIVCGMIIYLDSWVGKSLDEYVGFNACQEDCVLAPIVCCSCQWLETLQQNKKSDFRWTAIQFTLPEPWLIVVQFLCNESGLPVQHPEQDFGSWCLCRHSKRVRTTRVFRPTDPLSCLIWSWSVRCQICCVWGTVRWSAEHTDKFSL